LSQIKVRNLTFDYNTYFETERTAHLFNLIKNRRALTLKFIFSDFRTKPSSSSVNVIRFFNTFFYCF